MKISKMQAEGVWNKIILTHQSQVEYLFPQATQIALHAIFSICFCLQVRPTLVKTLHNKQLTSINSALYIGK